jgi:hypothetical protein
MRPAWVPLAGVGVTLLWAAAGAIGASASGGAHVDHVIEVRTVGRFGFRVR